MTRYGGIISTILCVYATCRACAYCGAAYHRSLFRFQIQTESSNRALVMGFSTRSRECVPLKRHSEMLWMPRRKKLGMFPATAETLRASAERSTLFIKHFHWIRRAQSALLQIFAKLPGLLRKTRFSAHRIALRQTLALRVF